jgi:hypothetical protein
MPDLHPDLSDEDIRIIQSIADFQMALSATTFLSETDEDANISRVERRRLRCFEDAAVVAYNRPFTNSNGLPRLTFEMIGLDPTTEEVDLHQRLRVRRDKVVGHTDVSKMRLALSTFQAFEDREIMMPLMDFDDALEFYSDRMALMAWLHKVIATVSKTVFARVQGKPALRFIKDHTLSDDK